MLNLDSTAAPPAVTTGVVASIPDPPAAEADPPPERVTRGDAIHTMWGPFKEGDRICFLGACETVPPAPLSVAHDADGRPWVTYPALLDAAEAADMLTACGFQAAGACVLAGGDGFSLPELLAGYGRGPSAT